MPPVVTRACTPSRHRIAPAVDDEDWQRFRVSMKGQPTERKLTMLKLYWERNDSLECDGKDCDICIRVDNYIKALCRGGQLEPGESLETALADNWKLVINK